MGDDIERQRAANLWDPFARKFPIAGRAARIAPRPEMDFDRIGGLAEPKEEIQTYACAATDPEVYHHWGTKPPAGLLLIGPPETGKSMLAEALATRTRTPFLELRVPRLALLILQSGGNVGPLLDEWAELLDEMPSLTVFFREVEFSRVESLVGRRPDVPVAPILDFLLELIDRTITVAHMMVVGSTGHPRQLSPVFLEPGRFERVVAVQPVVPDDVVAALRIRAGEAEQRAGRPLFADVDWEEAVNRGGRTSIGEWVRMLHGALRHKARAEAAEEEPALVTTDDLIEEADLFRRTTKWLTPRGGTYL